MGHLDPAPPNGSHNNPFNRRDSDALAGCFEALHIEARYNLRAALGEFREHQGDWQPASDRYRARVRERANAIGLYVRGPKETMERLNWSRDAFDSALLAHLYRNEVDPFADWLAALPAWDGTPRLDYLLTDLFGAPSDGLARWGGRYLFLGVVQRTYEPGCMLREMLTLVGEQRIGKSAFAREALPPEMPDLFTDNFGWDLRLQEQVEATLGCAVVEVSEMAGRYRADLEKMKSYISRREDGGARLAYARSKEPRPRRFVLIGTTNNQRDLPNDSSGNSRFVMVPLAHGSNIEAHMAAHRVQLWAEARHRYRAGERANLPDDLREAQAERNEEHRDRDDLIEDKIANLPTVDMTATEIRREASIPDSVSSRRLSDALLNADWAQKRTKQARLWTPPKGDG